MGAQGSSTDLQKSLTPEQRRLLGGVASLLTGQIGRGVEPYQGQTVPGESALQTSAFSQLLGAQPGSPEYENALSRALSGESAYSVDPAARERVYEAEKARALGEWRTEFAPNIEERYNAQGAGRSGGLERALAQSMGDVSLGLGSLYAGLGYQDEQARRAAAESAAGRQLAGVGAYQAGQAQDLQRLGMTLGAGEMQRGIAGEQLGEPYTRWAQDQPYANPWLQYLPTVLGTSAYTPVQSSWGFSLV